MDQRPESGSAPSWRTDVFDALKAAGVKHVAYVPDAGHATAIRLAEADPGIKAVVLTTEEEGIGYLAGAWLGGERVPWQPATSRRRAWRPSKILSPSSI